jgi:hypothetical protein
MRHPSVLLTATFACVLPLAALANGTSQCPPQGNNPPGAITGPGDGSGRGTVVTPPSSIEQPGDAGHRAHTTHKLFIPAQPDTSGSVEPFGVPSSCGKR